MTHSEDLIARPTRSLRDLAVQFLLGLLLGLLLVGVPLSYFWYFAPALLHPLHLVGAAGLILLCASLAAWRGDFLSLLTKLLEAMPSL